MNTEEKARFDLIYEKNKNLVFRAAMYYSKDMIAAEDFMQSAFLNLFIHFDDMVDEKHAEYWLLRTVKNMVLNYRKRGRREEVTEDITLTSDLHHHGISLEEEILTNEQNEMYKDFREEIFAALFDQNKNWYFAITLIYCKKKSYETAAFELGMNTESLYSLVYRAKQWINKNYGVRYQNLKSQE